MNDRRQNCSRVRVALSILFCCFARFAFAGSITTDKSFGHSAMTFTGANLNITPALGKQVGGNLFQSFKTFNLSSGDVATFSGPATVKNLLVRVTGGASNIDGTLGCSIPNADFYLIDPSGVVFGPEAKLNVQGSFIVATANEVKLGQGGNFSAKGSSSDVLTTAAPAAFGFLSGAPAPVTSYGNLAVQPRKGISVISGRVFLKAGQMVAESGQVNLVASGSKGDVTITSSAGATTSLDTSGLSSYADISFGPGVGVLTNGSFGGKIVIDGRNLSLDNAQISSDGNLARAGRGIALKLSGDLSMFDSNIQSNNSGTGRGGDVDVAAGNVTINGDSLAADNGIFTNSYGSGTGGSISVKTHTLSVVGSALLDIRPYATGNAGIATVAAHNILFDSRGTAVASDFATDNGIDAYEVGSATGSSGNVNIHADSFKLLNGGAIAADAGGPGGTGGVISVSANVVTINGVAADAGTGLLTDAESGGDAGSIRLRAASVNLYAGGEISSSANANGVAGNISIMTQKLIDDGADTSADVPLTTISVESNGTSSGDAGKLTLDADTLRILNGGEVSAETFGRGSGGGISITSHDMTVTGSDQSSSPTGVSVSSQGSSGKAGGLQIIAGTLAMYSGAQIEALTEGHADGGDLNVSASVIRIDGAHSNQFTGLTAQQETKGQIGSAGAIAVQSNQLLLNGGGRISDDTFGRGNGGTIKIQTTSLDVNGAGAEPNTGTGIDSDSRQKATGTGGSVIVDASTIHLLNGGFISAKTESAASGGNVTIQSSRMIVNGLGTPGNPSEISARSTSTATGAAGTVDAYASDEVELLGGAVTTVSAQGGASLSVRANNQIVLDDQASVSATAKRDGGNVTLSAPSLVAVDGASSVTTDGGKNGGNISMDTLRLEMDPHFNSRIQADGVGNGGNLDIAADARANVALAGANTDVTARGQTGVNGTIQNSFAQDDIASVTAPPVPLFSNRIGLAPICGMQVGSDQSSFTLEGGNGLPPEPGNVLPAGFVPTTRPSVR